MLLLWTMHTIQQVMKLAQDCISEGIRDVPIEQYMGFKLH